MYVRVYPYTSARAHPFGLHPQARGGHDISQRKHTVSTEGMHASGGADVHDVAAGIGESSPPGSEHGRCATEGGVRIAVRDRVVSFMYNSHKSTAVRGPHSPRVDPLADEDIVHDQLTQLPNIGRCSYHDTTKTIVEAFDPLARQVRGRSWWSVHLPPPARVMVG